VTPVDNGSCVSVGLVTATGFALAALAEMDAAEPDVPLLAALGFFELTWELELVRASPVSDRPGSGRVSHATSSRRIEPAAIRRGGHEARPRVTAGVQQAVGEEAPFGIRSISPHCSSFTVRFACGCDRSQAFPRAEGPSGLALPIAGRAILKTSTRGPHDQDPDTLLTGRILRALGERSRSERLIDDCASEKSQRSRLCPASIT